MVAVCDHTVGPILNILFNIQLADLNTFFNLAISQKLVSSCTYIVLLQIIKIAIFSHFSKSKQK